MGSAGTGAPSSCEHLALLLTLAPSLRSLDIGSCGFGPAASLALLGAVVGSGALSHSTSLRLSDSGLGAEAGQLLLAAAEEGWSALRTLEVWDNPSLPPPVLLQLAASLPGAEIKTLGVGRAALAAAQLQGHT